MATRIGDLPHYVWNDRKKEAEWCDFEGKSGKKYWSLLGFRTAHTTPNTMKRKCHCCGKVGEFIVKKPDIRFVWCLECF